MEVLMKLFTNFCGYFVLLVSCMLGIVCAYGAIDNISDFLKCEDAVAKAAYLNSGAVYLACMFIILTIGLALTAIIYLLRHIAYKNSEN